MTDKPWPLVDPCDSGIRPAGKPDECFYCRQKVGSAHARDCVIVTKRVRMRAVIEFETDEFPHHWGKQQIEFHHNEGTWCSDNFLDDLPKIIAKMNEGCSCNIIKFEYLSEDDKPLREVQTPDASKN